MCVLGFGAAAQHHPTDVWREGWGSRRAEAGPGRREEHVQNPNRWTAAKPEVIVWSWTVPPTGTQTTKLHIRTIHAVTETGCWVKPSLISGSHFFIVV